MIRVILFALILGALSLVTVAGVAGSIYFFEVDREMWTTVTSWKSPPVLAAAGVLVVSALATAVLSALGTFAMGRLAAAEKASARPRGPRPQSNRRTTL